MRFFVHRRELSDFIRQSSMVISSEESGDFCSVSASHGGLEQSQRLELHLVVLNVLQDRVKHIFDFFNTEIMAPKVRKNIQWYSRYSTFLIWMAGIKTQQRW